MSGSDREMLEKMYTITFVQVRNSRFELNL